MSAGSDPTLQTWTDEAHKRAVSAALHAAESEASRRMEQLRASHRTELEALETAVATMRCQMAEVCITFSLWTALSIFISKIHTRP
jgi:hypothetical protein